MSHSLSEERIPLLSSKAEHKGLSKQGRPLEGDSLNGETRYDSPCIEWKSLCVVYLVTLLSESSRGLFLASQWPYLERLGGSKSMLGMFVALFSVGRMLSTVPLGFLSDRFSIKTVFFWCTIFPNCRPLFVLYSSWSVCTSYIESFSWIWQCYDESITCSRHKGNSSSRKN